MVYAINPCVASTEVITTLHHKFFILLGRKVENFTSKSYKDNHHTADTPRLVKTLLIVTR